MLFGAIAGVCTEFYKHADARSCASRSFLITAGRSVMGRVPKGTDTRRSQKGGTKGASKSGRVPGSTDSQQQTKSSTDGRVPGGTDLHTRGRVPGGTD